MTEEEKKLRLAAVKALADREGWGEDVTDVARNPDGSFECGWHEVFFHDFMAGVNWARWNPK